MVAGAATTFLNAPATIGAHPRPVLRECAMRSLPVQMPPMTLERRGSARREIFYFLVAFAAMFGGAMLAIDLLL